MRRHILDKLIYGKNKNNIVRKVKTNVREMRISEKFLPKMQIKGLANVLFSWLIGLVV